MKTLVDTLIEMQSYSVQMRQRGQLTLPRKLRDALTIDEGDTLNMIQVGDAIFMTPRTATVGSLADEMVEMMEAKGLTLADLLESLPEIRAEIYQEKYGDSQ